MKQSQKRIHPALRNFYSFPQSLREKNGEEIYINKYQTPYPIAHILLHKSNLPEDIINPQELEQKANSTMIKWTKIVTEPVNMSLHGIFESNWIGKLGENILFRYLRFSGQKILQENS